MNKLSNLILPVFQRLALIGFKYVRETVILTRGSCKNVVMLLRFPQNNEFASNGKNM